MFEEFFPMGKWIFQDDFPFKSFSLSPNRWKIFRLSSTRRDSIRSLRPSNAFLQLGWIEGFFVLHPTRQFYLL